MTNFLKEFENIKIPLGNWKARREMNELRGYIEYYKKELAANEQRQIFLIDAIATHERVLSLMETRESLRVT